MSSYIELASSNLANCLLCQNPFTAQSPSVNHHKVGGVFHRFHNECLQNGVANRQNCPECDQSLAPERVRRVEQGPQCTRRGYVALACCGLFVVGMIGMFIYFGLRGNGPLPKDPFFPQN